MTLASEATTTVDQVVFDATIRAKLAVGSALDRLPVEHPARPYLSTARTQLDRTLEVLDGEAAGEVAA